VQHILKYGKYPCCQKYLNSSGRKFLPPGANFKKKIVEMHFASRGKLINYITFSFLLALVLIFLLYISKHTFLILPAREIKKKLNQFQLSVMPTNVKFDLREVPRNATLR